SRRSEPPSQPSRRTSRSCLPCVSWFWSGSSRPPRLTPCPVAGDDGIRLRRPPRADLIRLLDFLGQRACRREVVSERRPDRVGLRRGLRGRSYSGGHTQAFPGLVGAATDAIFGRV